MKKRLILLTTTLFLAFTPVTFVHGQVDSTIELSQVENVDTSTSIFPTVSYEIVEAERPSDQIEIDPDTLFSGEVYRLDDYYDEIIYEGGTTYGYMPKDNLRDITTYSTYYYYYSNPEYIELYAPINLHPDYMPDFNIADMAQGNLWDMSWKVNRNYMFVFTDDIYEAYDNSEIYSEEMMVDLKADLMRIEYFYDQVDENDPNYYSLNETYEEALVHYENYARRYDQYVLGEVEPFYGYGETVEQTPGTEALLEDIQLTLEPVPDSLMSKVGAIIVQDQYELPLGWDGSLIDAYAMTNMDMFFAEDLESNRGLTYHELGHLVDFSSMIYDGPASDTYNSFSNSEEFQEVYEAEWADDGSYYEDPKEAFAQGFGAYAMVHYQDYTIEEAGYVDFGLTGRPLTEAYFAQLFEDLGL